MSKHFSKKRKSKQFLKHKNKNNKKSRKNKKGGFLFDQNINVAGVDLSRQTGKKQYNWKTGKWDNLVCYGIGPLKGCKIVPAK